MEFDPNAFEDISHVIEEYALDNKLLADLTESVYDALMKKNRYSDAASLAKKYGL